MAGDTAEIHHVLKVLGASLILKVLKENYYL